MEIIATEVRFSGFDFPFMKLSGLHSSVPRIKVYYTYLSVPTMIYFADVPAKAHKTLTSLNKVTILGSLIKHIIAFRHLGFVHRLELWSLLLWRSL